MTTRRRRKPQNDNLRYILVAAFIGLIVIGLMADHCSTKSRQENAPMTGKTEHDGLDSALLAVQGVDNTDITPLSYPGFNVAFSNSHHQPAYAAWILTGEQTNGTHKRANNFRPDPAVANSPQLDDYRNSGFDKGHMAPSGDMKHDFDAQSASFFLTNMSPQKHELNNGAWKKLEEKCRQWAVRDSALVIVCGPVLTDHLTRHIGASHITVPDRYFKVVLAPYANPPRAIGFIMPNGYVPGGMQQCAMSVDDVERITGYDFFAALPDSIENIIEQQSKLSTWTYNR